MTMLKPSPPSPPSPPLLPLELHGVGYRQGNKWLLQDVSLTIKPPAESGNITAIIGPNGAGKTLLLQILHGLLPASCGEISMSADNINCTALSMQNPIFLRRSVANNLAVALKSKTVPKPEHATVIDDLLKQAGLQNLARQPARSLSAGERQIIDLLRASIGSPQLLLLDEPCANLDPSATDNVEKLIHDIASVRSIKIILVTHDMAQAKRLADEVIFMHQGRVCEMQPAEVFFASPSSLEARRYLSGELLR